MRTSAALRSNQRRLSNGNRQSVNSRVGVRDTNFVSKQNLQAKISEIEASEAIVPIIAEMPAKVLANLTERSIVAAKGWKSGRNFPNGASLINLARNLPTVRAWVADHCGMPQDTASAELSALKELATYDSPEGEIARKALALVRK